VKCKSCGSDLRGPSRRAYRRRYEDDLCFEPVRGLSLLGIFFGVLIVLAGVIWLLEGYVMWVSWERLWPFVVILFGLIIVVSTLAKR
jgi:hypothetical protein